MRRAGGGVRRSQRLPSRCVWPFRVAPFRYLVPFCRTLLSFFSPRACRAGTPLPAAARDGARALQHEREPLSCKKALGRGQHERYGRDGGHWQQPTRETTLALPLTTPRRPRAVLPPAWSLLRGPSPGRRPAAWTRSPGAPGRAAPPPTSCAPRPRAVRRPA